MTRLWRILVAALLVTLTAPRTGPPGADQCAPPGADSASALPTNLAAAAGGPGSDRYTTPAWFRWTASTATRSGSAHRAP
jgi:polar amino acid transport system substrate-binding protein